MRRQLLVFRCAYQFKMPETNSKYYTQMDVFDDKFYKIYMVPVQSNLLWLHYKNFVYIANTMHGVTNTGCGLHIAILYFI